jgi:hypothetical protein
MWGGVAGDTSRIAMDGAELRRASLVGAEGERRAFVRSETSGKAWIDGTALAGEVKLLPYAELEGQKRQVRIGEWVWRLSARHVVAFESPPHP